MRACVGGIQSCSVWSDMMLEAFMNKPGHDNGPQLGRDDLRWIHLHFFFQRLSSGTCRTSIVSYNLLKDNKGCL